MSWLYDDRSECYSVQTTMHVGEYINLVMPAHKKQGALTGQRDTLKTTTAKRIRTRMIADIRRGAVLPPVVIGAVVDEEKFSTYPLSDSNIPSFFLSEKAISELSIIDGMQRTEALQEAVREDASVRRRSVRVEFWITRTVRTMVYRMLVLNTGQVPWTLARQLSVVYAPLLDEIQEKVPELSRVFTPDNPGRRVAAAEIASDAIVELYIAFSLRKTGIDTKEALSDEFSRLDFVDNLSDHEFQVQFYQALDMMAALDKSFSKHDSFMKSRYSKGRNIFDAQPARIGFIVAVAFHVLGRPGMDRKHDDRVERMRKLGQQVRSLRSRLKSMNNDDLGNFIKLDVLSETLDKRVGQVGRYERSVFYEAFSALIAENFDVPNMEPCWRAN